MPEKDRWEYRIEEIGSFWRASKAADVEAFLNSLGEEGWDVINLHQPENSNKIWVTAKRPLTTSTRRRRNLPGEDW